jgi:hypothetical protein
MRGGNPFKVTVSNHSPASKETDTRARKRRAAGVKYSNAIAEEICFRMASGESLKGICRSPGMPTFQSVLRWVLERPEFARVYALACDMRAQYLADEILEIADTIEPGERVKKSYKGTEVTVGDMVERSKLRVDARKWLLARLAPKRYGDKITQEISGPDGGPIVTEGEYRMTPEDEAFIKRAAAAREMLARERLARQQDEQRSAEP